MALKLLNLRHGRILPQNQLILAKSMTRANLPLMLRPQQRAHLRAPEMPGSDEAGPAVVTSSPTTTELRRGPRPPQKVCLWTRMLDQ